MATSTFVPADHPRQLSGNRGRFAPKEHTAPATALSESDDAAALRAFEDEAAAEQRAFAEAAWDQPESDDPGVPDAAAGPWDDSAAPF